MIHHPSHKISSKQRGFTLMETVIALGIIAFAVPIILAATSNGSKSRRNGEAETRSAWIATDLQRTLTEAWRDIPHEAFAPPPVFPDFSAANAPLVFHYDNNGKFLEVGNNAEFQNGTKLPRSVYLVTIYGVGRDPQNLNSTPRKQLSLVTIDVHFPAQAPLGRRQISTYNVMIPRQKQL